MRIAVIENGRVSNFVEFESLGDAIAFYSDSPEVVVVDSTGIYCDIGWSYASGQFIQPVVVISLAEAIAQKQIEMQDFAQYLLALCVDGYTNEERDMWPGKLNAAIKFMATRDPNDAPFLLIEATHAGIPLEMLASIVIAKADFLSAKTAQIAGNRTRHYFAIAALQSMQAVQSYNFSDGWVS